MLKKIKKLTELVASRNQAEALIHSVKNLWLTTATNSTLPRKKKSKLR